MRWLFSIEYQLESVRLNHVGATVVGAHREHLVYHQPAPRSEPQSTVGKISLSTSVVENIIPSCDAVMNG